MTVDALTYGPRIRAARERRGLKQRPLAVASGLSQPVLHRLEAAERTATVPELIRIAAALGTTLGDLTGHSPVRDRLVFAARTNDDAAAEEMKERLAYYLEMDAYFDELGYSATT
ncbi:helix-turn-helix domain-containing protein [Pedococcus bigeumensis]|uniref:XRE family transcriptional regulator n=1 Tax=Pedococcus bigeumensis TaxID=433644 RepID=A0A502CWK4_9MICO|nr:helix-turn-helix transcriptional regulator [Pedococcus bigeumensis]TPG17044.1 XRE family transcriptional regulator [Pedococcus bigeumensis]